MKFRLALLIGLAAFVLGGCEKSSTLDKPRMFFSENKSGTSPDYGIFKGFGDDDHVVTVHGFMDDLNICMKLAAKFNEEEPGACRCIPLNH
jgi:ABC-type glycerol-3-phosphate transport system substrate-binding protein